MSLEIPFQPETDMNGALAMAWQKALPYARAARTEGTLRVYAHAWGQWDAWCRLMHTRALPANPSAVAAYLAELARNGGASVSHIRVTLAAIQFAHQAAGHGLDRKHPALAHILAGITRKQARPVRQASPLSLADLRKLIVGITGDDIRAKRDRALLLVGFFGALRRSEICKLDVTGPSPIEITAQGLKLHLTDTKTSAETQTVALPRRNDDLCPVAAVERYLEAAQISTGPLFRPVSKAGRLIDRGLDASSVRHVLQERVRMAWAHDCEAALSQRMARLSPHSLRAGFITAAANAGAPEHVIQRTSRHKSIEVLRSYIRGTDAFAENAANYF